MLYGALEAEAWNKNGLRNRKWKREKYWSRYRFRLQHPKRRCLQSLNIFQNREIAAIGVACFGPVDLNLQSQTYGCILQTPKIALAWIWYGGLHSWCTSYSGWIWYGCERVSSWRSNLGLCKGLENAVYFTIGTGIGAGIMTNGKMLHGMLHPEAGHFMLSVRSDDTYKERCPSHGTFWKAWQQVLQLRNDGVHLQRNLQTDPRYGIWKSYYLAQAVVSCVMLLSPADHCFRQALCINLTVISADSAKVQMINGYIQTPLDWEIMRL